MLFLSIYFDPIFVLKSISVLKETEKQLQHLKIDTRRNYFSDHLVMQIKLRFV